MVHRSRDDIFYLVGISTSFVVKLSIEYLYILIDMVQARQLRKSAALLIASFPDNNCAWKNEYIWRTSEDGLQIIDFGLKSSVCIHPPIELGPFVPCIVFCSLPHWLMDT